LVCGVAESASAHFEHARQRFDPLGAALLATGFALLTLALSFARNGVGDRGVFSCVWALSLAALLVVPAAERRAADPS